MLRELGERAYVQTRSGLTARVLIWGIVLLVLCGLPLFARGQSEDPIAEARDLIIRNRLNDAIRILTNVIRTDPERIDEAERLLRLIRSLRSEYQELFDELIDTLINEPENPEKALAIIDQMENLDESPNPRTQEQILQARDTVEFRFNVNQVNQVMSRAAEHIAAEEYQQALRTYLTGFEYFRSDFEQADYSEDFVVRRAESARERLRTAATEAAEAIPELSDTQLRFTDRLAVQAGAGDLDALRAELRSTVHALGRDGGEVLAAAETLTAVNRQIGIERGDESVDNYITVLSWYAVGRPGVEEGEGMLFAIRSAVASELEPLRSLALEQGDGNFEEARALLAQGSFREAAESFDNSRSLDVLAAELGSLFGSIIEFPRDGDLSPRSVDLVERALPETLGARARAAVSSELVELAENWSDLSQVPAVSELGLDELADIRQRYSEILSFTDRAAAETGERLDTLRESQEAYADERSLESLAFALDQIATQTEEVRERDRLAAVRAADLRFAALADPVPDYALRVNQSDTLIFRGITQTSFDPSVDLPNAAFPEPDESEAVFRFPAQATTLLETVVGELQTLSGEVSQEIATLQAEPAYIRSYEPHQAAEEGARELQARVTTLLNRAQSLLDQAQERVQTAAQLEAEASLRISQAEQAINQQNLSVANQRFEDARERFFESLELQQDPELRDSSDQRLAALGESIRDLEFQIAVQEIRRLIDQGRTQYRRDEFAQAESTLIQANNLWEQVNPTEENEEITYWLQLAQAALNLQNDRELTETDPLFRPLGNYLNLAQQNFEQAETALDDGSQERANQLLARAQENIQSVVFAKPFNQQARVLSLRILRITNPEDFPELFQSRYEEALDEREDNPFSALNQLYDLQEIDPNYPGLQEVIINLEIDLGIRPAPVDTAALNRSQALLAEARQLAAGGSRGQIEVAIARLQEAIQLNPENDQAVLLLDQLRIQLGSSATVVLSSANEQLFREAQEAFIDGNLGNALSIVNRLWQNEQNRRYAPLVDLREQILEDLGS